MLLGVGIAGKNILSRPVHNLCRFAHLDLPDLYSFRACFRVVGSCVTLCAVPVCTPHTMNSLLLKIMPTSSTFSASHTSRTVFMRFDSYIRQSIV